MTQPALSSEKPLNRINKEPFLPERESLIAEAQDILEIASLDDLNAALAEDGRLDLITWKPVRGFAKWRPASTSASHFAEQVVGLADAMNQPVQECEDYSRFAGMGIDAVALEEGREALVPSTLFNKEAFGRLWSLFPELTKRLVLDTVAEEKLLTPRARLRLDGPIYQIYVVLGKLVDETDAGVIDQNYFFDS